jgi:hypothetical protein
MLNGELGTSSIVNVLCTKLIRVDFHRRRRPAQLGARRAAARTHGITSSGAPPGSPVLRRMGINEHAKVKVAYGLSFLPRGLNPRAHLSPPGKYHVTTISACAAATSSRSAATARDPRQRRRQGHGPQGAQAVPRQVLAVRRRRPPTPSPSSSASRPSSRKHQGTSVRSAHRADQGLAHRSRAAPPRSDARGGRQGSARLIITGNGDVLEPEHGIVAIGSGGAYAQAAARALARAHRARAGEIVKSRSRSPASCASTPTSITRSRTLE